MMRALVNRVVSIPILAFGLAACSGDNDGSGSFTEVIPLASYNFDVPDSAMQTFVDENAVFEGISYTIVDQEQGTVHEAAFGDHELDIVVLLASTSKMPVALLMMALHDDPAVEFDINTPISNYLPWMGLYGDASTAQLLSNTSGIPGLEGLGSYGASLCQFAPLPDLLGCAETIYTTPVAGSVAPGTRFSYGGSQWQLAGAVAEVVGGASWAQLFAQYIAEPCDLEVFSFGNPWSNVGAWTGSPDSLIGRDNPNIEGGAISNMRDYAKLLQMTLDGGMCGDTQVLSAESLAFMREDKGGALGTPYGMGWWLIDSTDGGATSLFYDPGAFGAVSWIDTERNYAGYLAVDDYTRVDSGAPVALTLGEIIPLVAAAIDQARADVAR